MSLIKGSPATEQADEQAAKRRMDSRERERQRHRERQRQKQREDLMRQAETTEHERANR